MDYKHFEEKYVDEINLEELQWIRSNGYINNYPYYGQKFILTGKLRLDRLRLRYPAIIDKIKEYHGEFLYSNEIQHANTIFKYLHLLNRELYNNFNEFIDDLEMVEDYTSLYVIIRDVENNLYKKYSTILKHPIRWRLWPEYLVRTINENDTILMRKAIPFAERGDYCKALKNLGCLEDELNRLRRANFDVGDDGKSNSGVLSWWFYKMKLEYMSGVDCKDSFNNVVGYINKYRQEFESSWSLTKLKIAETHLDASKFLSINLIDEYKFWLRSALEDCTKNDTFQFIPMNFKIAKIKLDHNRNNIEIVREPMLNLMYYLDIKKGA